MICIARDRSICDIFDEKWSLCLSFPMCGGAQGFLVLFQSTSDTIVAGMLLSLTYLKMIQLLRPFADHDLNRIKETSIWQIFFVFLIALLLKNRDVNSDILTICLFLIFFLNFFLLLGQSLVQCGQKRSCVSVLRSKSAVQRQSSRDVKVMEKDGAIYMERCSSLSSRRSASVGAVSRCSTHHVTIGRGSDSSNSNSNSNRNSLGDDDETRSTSEVAVSRQPSVYTITKSNSASASNSVSARKDGGEEEEEEGTGGEESSSSRSMSRTLVTHSPFHSETSL